MGIVPVCADPGRHAMPRAPRHPSSRRRYRRLPPVLSATSLARLVALVGLPATSLKLRSPSLKLPAAWLALPAAWLRLRAASVPLLVASVALLPVTAAAQGFSGRVVDADDGTGVAGAQVSLLGAGDEVIRGVVADSVGRFTLPVARLDTFRLRVEHIAYRTITSSPYVFEAPAIVEVELRVSQQEIELEPLVVTAVRGTGHPRLADFYRRVRQYEATGRGIQLTREELEPYTGRTVLDVFALQPVRFQRMNPLQPCRIRTYWNDMLVEDVSDEEWRGYDLPGGQALDELPASSVEGLEIYDHLGEIPPRYADYNVCGVILIWSRAGPEPGSSTRLWLARGLIGVGAFLVLTLLGG